MQQKISWKTADELPSQPKLPDPFLRPDGKRIRDRWEWAFLRKHWLAQVLYYEYGELPPKPRGVEAQRVGQTELGDISAQRVELRLRILTPVPLEVRLLMFRPKKGGKLPVVVNGDLGWGEPEGEIVQEVARRGYVLVCFDRTAVAPDSAERRGIYEAYPDYEGGRLAAWAWAYHRVVDFLQTQPGLDAKRIAVTGHSRGGKTVLLAGATDERIALTAPNNSGCGGAGCYRYQGPNSETIQNILDVFPYWFHPRFRQFVGKVDRLPFDQHIVKALVAPRALLSTEALGDLWANPAGTQMTYLAAREVYRFLRAEERIGIWFREGGHAHSLADWQALLDFADWHLLGKVRARAFDQLAFPEMKPFYTWRAPG
ncbi:MAG: glucuronyl esterase domain-containing protein [Armatimonadota bacterium]